ncbi:MAG: hypothetical protein IJ828_09575 [Treponema sp.]|nr:hypothetical protein [Treponema sp.]
MTLEAAILSFYLLFPVITDGQIYIDRNLEQRILSDRERIHKISLLQDFLAGRHTIDDSSFVIQAHVPLLMNEIGLGAEEHTFKNNDGKIRLQEFGVEKFSVEQNASAGKNVVYVNNRQFLQISYDEHFRISEKTLWQNSEKSSDIKLLQKTTFHYEGESEKLSSVSYEYISKDMMETISYNKAGNPVRIRSYTMYDGKWVLTKLHTYSYDEKQRIVSEEESSYGNKSFASKTVYRYTKKSPEPDIKYYENGVLRSSTTYDSADLYNTTTYFDNRYSITVTYQNKKRVKEVVSLNGVRQRARVFDE